MSDDEPPPPPQGPAPALLWAVLGILLVIGFLVLLKMFIYRPAL
jgi:hypothetical protein